MTRISCKKILKVVRPGLIVILSLCVIIVFLYSFFIWYNQGRIYPGVKIGGIDVGTYSLSQAVDVLNSENSQRIQQPLTWTFQDKILTLNLDETNPSLNINQSINQALKIGRSGDLFADLLNQIKALFGQINLTPSLTFNKSIILNQEFDLISQKISRPAKNATLTLNQSLTITPSQKGLTLNRLLLYQQIINFLTKGQSLPKEIPTKKSLPSFTTEEAFSDKQILERIKSQPIIVNYKNQSWEIDEKTAYNLLNMDYSEAKLLSFNTAEERFVLINAQVGETSIIGESPTLNTFALNKFIANIASEVDRLAQDARFSVETNPDGSLRVSKFTQSETGLAVDQKATAAQISDAILHHSSSNLSLIVKTTQPKTDTADSNSLGIKDLLGEGVSHFAGSADSRIYNINLAASRINGVIIAPGDTFSFDKSVGDISNLTGYKQAYVIQNGRTVLGDGGGVCQVSTTVFRAALNSGLPITDRTAHAYRVGYYEQGFPPGLDATIYVPTVDLKFRNDTNAYVLLQSKVIGDSLYIDLYGTNDGRTVTLTQPRVTNQTPPPPSLMEPDPTLPKGTIKQVDWSAWGADVSFDRVVTRNGKILINEVWASHYRPWQAVYLVGSA